jgi:hypothetical protein
LAVTAVPCVPAAAKDVCSLATTAEVAKVIGAKPEQVSPMLVPPRQDKTGGYVSFCAYSTPAPDAPSLVVSILEFRSSAAARQTLTEALIRERMPEESTQVSEEGNLGERSLYGVSNNGATYVFVKKNKVIGVAQGGAAGKASAGKTALLQLAQAVASRI